jgi:hypothetical protein
VKPRVRSYRAVRRVALVLTGTALTVVVLSVFGPMGENTLGLTFCFPVVGPVERLNSTLSDSLLSSVRAHESAHADQCRRDGALWHTLRRLAPRVRLLSAAEGYCAEIRYGLSTGGAARLLYASALDELRERWWFHRFATSTLVDALATQCPSLVVRAAREEAEWRASVRAHHAQPRTT